MSALQQLLHLGDLLRSQHRAGIVPPAGQIESLFDLMADVRGELATGQITVAAMPLSAGTPPTAVLLLELRDAAGQVLNRMPVQAALGGPR